MFKRATSLGLFISLLGTSALAFDLQGHRGARGLVPENTLPAFAKALSIGVTTLELDTGVTKDGIVVVSHDPSLNKDLTRDASGKWVTKETKIVDLTFSELQQFDVGRLSPGSRTASRFPTQTAIDGTKIPSLLQVFELADKAGNASVRFNIETKINPLKPAGTVDPDRFANAILSVVASKKLEGRVSIQSFDWRTLQAVQKANPLVETVYLTAQQDWLDNVSSKNGAPSDWTAGFNLDDHGGSVPKLISAAGGAVWSPFARDLSLEKVKEAQALGLKVIPWTVNQKEDMQALIKLGVDGLISDYPDVLREVMKEANLPLPEATPVKP